MGIQKSEKLIVEDRRKGFICVFYHRYNIYWITLICWPSFSKHKAWRWQQVLSMIPALKAGDDLAGFANRTLHRNFIWFIEKGLSESSVWESTFTVWKFMNFVRGLRIEGRKAWEWNNDDSYLKTVIWFTHVIQRNGTVLIRLVRATQARLKFLVVFLAARLSPSPIL